MYTYIHMQYTYRFAWRITDYKCRLIRVKFIWQSFSATRVHFRMCIHFHLIQIQHYKSKVPFLLITRIYIIWRGLHFYNMYMISWNAWMQIFLLLSNICGHDFCRLRWPLWRIMEFREQTERAACLWIQFSSIYIERWFEAYFLTQSADNGSHKYAVGTKDIWLSNANGCNR